MKTTENNPRIRRQFNPDYKGSPGETFTQKSKTIPDQSLTIREILINHSKGIPTNINHHEQGQFLDQEVPRFDDITELMEYKQQLQQEQIELDKIVQAEVDKQMLKRAAKAKKEAEALKSEYVAKTPPKSPDTA